MILFNDLNNYGEALSTTARNVDAYTARTLGMIFQLSIPDVPQKHTGRAIYREGDTITP